MARAYKILTEDQAKFFLDNGYVVIKQAFTKETAEEWSRNLWVRLDIDPAKKSTWARERIHMPWHKRVPVAGIAPKAWAAMNDLLGEGRIKEEDSTWGDSFILNLGMPELNPDTSTSPHALDNWHVDGDFFVHYLDSPEQALLVIPLFSDIRPRGGGTFIAPEGIDHVARYLVAHPEGVVPAQGRFVSSVYAEDPSADPSPYVHTETVKNCTQFAEMTGEIGDVVLMHPLMLHSASKNHLRDARVIINPPVALKEPFNFNRADPGEFSLVELKTLRAVGVEKLDFRPTTERRRIAPKSSAAKNTMLKEERERIAAYEQVHGPTLMSIVPAIIAPV